MPTLAGVLAGKIGYYNPRGGPSLNNGAEREVLVSMQGIGVRRGEGWLVRDIDLSIHQGEIVTLIGPNGSGKSTSVKVVTGVIKPSAGNVWRRPGLKVALVPQKLHIEWTLPLSVKRLMVLSEPHGGDEVMQELERVGAAHLKNAAVQSLSGGEFQRVLLARAMIRNPDLLVLDEPVQGVDFAGQVALYELIKDIRDRTGCGILMISHDLHVVMGGTDQVICLNGHVCCSGPPEQVARSDAYKALFGADPDQALALYRHRHDHTHASDGSVQKGTDHVG